MFTTALKWNFIQIKKISAPEEINNFSGISKSDVNPNGQRSKPGTRSAKEVSGQQGVPGHHTTGGEGRRMLL